MNYDEFFLRGLYQEILGQVQRVAFFSTFWIRKDLRLLFPADFAELVPVFRDKRRNRSAKISVIPNAIARDKFRRKLLFV